MGFRSPCGQVHVTNTHRLIVVEARGPVADPARVLATQPCNPHLGDPLIHARNMDMHRSKCVKRIVEPGTVNHVPVGRGAYVVGFHVQDVERGKGSVHPEALVAGLLHAVVGVFFDDVGSRPFDQLRGVANTIALDGHAGVIRQFLTQFRVVDLQSDPFKQPVHIFQDQFYLLRCQAAFQAEPARFHPRSSSHILAGRYP